MTDIILECLRAIFVILIFIFLLIKSRSTELKDIKDSFGFMVVGFGLICFGSLIDITDNFDSLNKFVILGDTEYQAVLEKSSNVGTHDFLAEFGKDLKEMSVLEIARCGHAGTSAGSDGLFVVHSAKQ